MASSMYPSVSVDTADTDTIAAQATSPGRGGVGVIRISGPHVVSIMQHMLLSELTPRHATYLPFLDAEQQVIDQGIAIYFPHPHSFTGEDVLELQGHGGPIIMDMLLERILQLGARLAKPGEFSERAFLNEKLDLAQAEAIADLINASSQQAARLAMRSLQGDFSKAVQQINEQVITLRLFIEAAIDFVDEEVDILSDATISQQLLQLHNALLTIQQQAKQGSLLREGITVVIIGEPNVGKSSLLNALSGESLAIVTDIPGTTRDVIRNQILINGIPLHIVDTAGLRASNDLVEQEGIRRAYQEMIDADLILYLIDAQQTFVFDEKVLPKEVHGRPVIVVRNKIDLLDACAHQMSIESLEESNTVIINLSAKTGLGIALLQQHILSLIGFHQEEGLFLARRRHLDALAQALQYVNVSLQLLKDGSRSSELIAEELRLTQRTLSEITGEFTADDLLGRIFSQFCIGK